MSLSPQSDDPIAAAVALCSRDYQLADRPVCLAFSGGIDSSVLLHALAHSGLAQLRAVHVNHQLSPESADWALECQKLCAQLDVPLRVLRVDVDTSSGAGPEAAARDARYAAFATELAPEEVLLTAHHRNDQMETFLLRLFRGAGLHGLAAMGVHSSHNGIDILRPLLDVPGEAIVAYADNESLGWVADPSNTDTRFDRNYLRHVVVPGILERWPAADRAIARAARLGAEAVDLLDASAAADLGEGLHDNRLMLDVLRPLPAARQRNVLRGVLSKLKLPTPSERQLIDSLQLMLDARIDGKPIAAWPGVRIYRFRDQLWMYSEHRDPANLTCPDDEYSWTTQRVLDMGAARGTLEMLDQAEAGIATEFLQGELTVRFRRGGEKLRIMHEGPSRDLKKLLQESDIAPWMRCYIPLIYCGERLLAVGDLWVNADYAAGPDEAGRVIVWRDHFAIR